MGKKVFYTYNPITDDFERYYPNISQRLGSLGRALLLGGVMGAGLYALSLYVFDSPTTKNLRQENKELREHYALLDRRLESALKVMEDIRNRDDNFYRVMMQLEPMDEVRRFAGMDNESKYRQLRKMSDASIVEDVTRNLDMLEREIAAQSQSFDELRGAAIRQRERMLHTPQSLPVGLADFTIAAGYGYRRNPLTGTSTFHPGIDLMATTGAAVMATADGTVKDVKRDPLEGNVVVIDHGFDYITRYCHLSQTLTKEGDNVKRGEIIGKVGSSGRSSAPHLHYEVILKGEPQNPVNFFFTDLTTDQYKKIVRQSENAGHVMD